MNLLLWALALQLIRETPAHILPPHLLPANCTGQLHTYVSLAFRQVPPFRQWFRVQWLTPAHNNVRYGHLFIALDFALEPANSIATIYDSIFSTLTILVKGYGTHCLFCQISGLFAPSSLFPPPLPPPPPRQLRLSSPARKSKTYAPN